MVGRLFAFLKDVGHAEGVAHLNEPITDSSYESVVDAVEAAKLPRGDVLLPLFAFHFHDIVAADAETDLRPDTKPRNHRLVFVVFVPAAQVDVEQ